MTHTVLARKWRPKQFADLVGQNATVTILHNIITSQRLHHAYLLNGTRGVGKTTIARIIAKALNCQNRQDSEPCGSCNSCQQIDNGRFVDVIEIDAASNTGVDNIREVLDNAQFAPTSGSYKIFIIDEVHMLSRSAFNAMLKTLEEPPAHIVFILATTDLHKVPITVLSRCLQLKLRNLSPDEISQHLAMILTKEQISFEREALELLATAAKGSMRDALSLTDQAIAFSAASISAATCRAMLGISDEETIFALLNAIVDGRSADIVAICEKLQASGSNLEQVLAQLNHSLFQIGLAQLSPQPQLNPQLHLLANSIGLQDCQLYFEISNLGLEQMQKVDHQYPILVMTLLRMVAFTIGSNHDKQLLVAANNPQPLPQPNITVAPKQQPQVQIQAPVPKHHEVEEPVVVEIREVAPAPAITAPPQQWLDFVKSLDYSQLPPDLGVVLRNSAQIESTEPEQLNLVIADQFRSLVTTTCVDHIEKLLAEHYSQHFDLNFNFSESEISNSLREHEAKEAQQRQQQAEQAIKDDPIIQDLITNFSAKIVPNSIQPL